ncbi:MAG: DUF5334 domain-containing protein [Rickettsiales bacterium]|nr:DUF5334 domain-containing protein [Rickettsiales bacterium]
MKTTPQFLLFMALFIPKALAWEGFDQENNTIIEIPSGNLVREGLMIEFYENDILHNGKVLTMNEMAAGTELLVEDFNSDKKERNFIMQ